VKEKEPTTVVGVRMAVSNRALLEEEAKARSWKLSALVFECLRLGFERLSEIKSRGEEAGVEGAQGVTVQEEKVPKEKVSTPKEEKEKADRQEVDYAFVESLRAQIEGIGLNYDAALRRLRKRLAEKGRPLTKGFLKGWVRSKLHDRVY